MISTEYKIFTYKNKYSDKALGLHIEYKKIYISLQTLMREELNITFMNTESKIIAIDVGELH